MLIHQRLIWRNTRWFKYDRNCLHSCLHTKYPCHIWTTLYITGYIYIPVTFNCMGIGDLNVGTGEKILTFMGFT